VSVHIIAGALFIVSIGGVFVHIFHHASRQDLRLAAEPGTIASAVAFGAQTTMASLLNGRQDEMDLRQALKDRKFRIDPTTNKIIMEGEEGEINFTRIFVPFLIYVTLQDTKMLCRHCLESRPSGR
jgi:hypothetical protein